MVTRSGKKVEGMLSTSSAFKRNGLQVREKGVKPGGTPFEGAAYRESRSPTAVSSLAYP